MDLGPHAAFIWTTYAAVALVVGALMAWLILDGRAQRRAIEDLESRGVRRRSASNESSTT